MIQIMKCCICGEMAKAHLLILGKNICSCCEEKIIQIKAEDKDYHDYQDRLKNLFCNFEKLQGYPN